MCVWDIKSKVLSILFFIVLMFALTRFLLATTSVTIQGGPVKTTGGYMDIGTTVIVTTTPVVELQGQCIGILCGVTYN